MSYFRKKTADSTVVKHNNSLVLDYCTTSRPEIVRLSSPDSTKQLVPISKQEIRKIMNNNCGEDMSEYANRIFKKVVTNNNHNNKGVIDETCDESDGNNNSDDDESERTKQMLDPPRTVLNYVETNQWLSRIAIIAYNRSLQHEREESNTYALMAKTEFNYRESGLKPGLRCVSTENEQTLTNEAISSGSSTEDIIDIFSCNSQNTIGSRSISPCGTTMSSSIVLDGLSRENMVQFSRTRPRAVSEIAISCPNPVVAGSTSILHIECIRMGHQREGQNRPMISPRG